MSKIFGRFHGNLHLQVPLELKVATIPSNDESEFQRKKTAKDLAVISNYIIWSWINNAAQHLKREIHEIMQERISDSLGKLQNDSKTKLFICEASKTLKRPVLLYWKKYIYKRLINLLNNSNKRPD